MSKIYKFFHHYFHTHYFGIYRHARKLFVFDLALLFLAGVMLVAGLFFLFWRPSLLDAVDLKISWGNARIKSGQEILLTIGYANRAKYNLKDAVLSINLPEGFVVDRNKTPESQFSADSIFDLGTLAPGANGKKEIYGRIWSEPGQENKIISLLSFRPEYETVNREQKIASALINLPESVIASRLEIATSTFPNQTVPFNLIYTNTGNQAVSGINIDVAWVGAVEKTGDWNTFFLNPGESKTITGVIRTPRAGGNYQLSATAKINLENIALIQNLNRANLLVFSPDIKTEVKILDNKPYADPGSELKATVSWRNSSRYQLKNFKIKITPTPGVVDMKATARANNFKIENDSLVADSSSKTALTDGKPLAEGSFDFDLILLPTFATAPIENVYLQIEPTAAAEIAEIGGGVFENPGVSAQIPLPTNLSWSAETRYFTPEGDQLGRGPLPPTVDETTKYWIFINIKNTTNAVTDAKFSATLAPGVTFTGKQSVSIGPQIQNSNGNVTWSYSELPANSNTGLYFEVAVTPTTAQIGKNLDLINSLKFSATDDWIKKTFTLSSGALNNILKNNDLGAEMGSVVSN